MLGLRLQRTFKKAYDYRGEETNPIMHVTSLTIHSKFDHSYELLLEDVNCRKSLGTSRAIPNHLLQEYDLEFADDSNHSDMGHIDLILSAKVFSICRTGGFLRITYCLIAEHTSFGWVASGSYAVENSNTLSCNRFQSVSTVQCQMIRVQEDDDEVDNDIHLNLFFEIVSDEQKMEDFFNNFTHQRKDERLVVPLLIKEGCSRICRAYNLLSPEIQQKYVSIFRDWEAQGFIKRRQGEVLPVFDSSMKSSNGNSLISIQLDTPMSQTNTQNNFIQFRVFPVAILADIASMFLQIQLGEEFHKWQATYVPDEAGKLQLYFLTTGIFGNTPSPYSTINSLLYLAEKYSEQFPLGVQILRHFFYVDECLASFNSVELAMRAIWQLVQILNAAKLPIRKWLSNHPEALIAIDPAYKMEADSKQIINDGIVTQSNMLGLRYHPKSDKISFKVSNFKKYEPDEKVCLRNQLSRIALIYDSTGVLSPLFITGILLIQKTYEFLLGIKGKIKKNCPLIDQPLDENLSKPWKEWCDDVLKIQNYEIPRWLGHKLGNHLSIIATSDASQNAYAAAIYMRSESDCEVHTHLLVARACCKPIKANHTISRLKLLGLLLSVELTIKCKKALQHACDANGDGQKIRVIYLCSSQIVIAWVQSLPDDRMLFVRNKLIKIHRLQSPLEIFYIESELNSSNLATRGMTSEQLLASKLWQEGPLLIKEKSFFYTLHHRLYNTNEEELKTTPCQVVNTRMITIEPPNDLISVMEDISDWSRTVRRVASLLKTTKMFQTSATKFQLEPQDLVQAEYAIFRACQQHAFGADYWKVVNKRQVLSGPLMSLRPFSDAYGVLHHRSCLENHDGYSEEVKFPIIIPKPILNKGFNKKCQISVKLIHWAHNKVMHGGLKNTDTCLRQRFFLIGAISSIKFVLHRCLKCKLTNAKLATQQMCCFPIENITACPPWTHVCVDKAGPFGASVNRQRFTRNKDDKKSTSDQIYLMLFLCRNLRCVHIEVISGQTKQKIQAAIENFTAVRGVPKSFHLDSLPKHKAAAKDIIMGTSNTNHRYLIKELRKQLEKKNPNLKNVNKILNNCISPKEHAIDGLIEAFQEIQERYPEQKLLFRSQKKLGVKRGNIMKMMFLPGSTPHINAIVEIELKMVKDHIKKAVGHTKLSFEQWYNISKKIECAINNRPLFTLMYDNGKKIVVSPSHFISQRPLNLISNDEIHDCVTKGYHQQTAILNIFNKSYREKIFNTMSQCSKWYQETPSVGEVVLTRDEAPIGTWPKGVIRSVKTGNDSLVRVVEIRNDVGRTLTREFNQIVRLQVKSVSEFQTIPACLAENVQEATSNPVDNSTSNPFSRSEGKPREEECENDSTRIKKSQKKKFPNSSINNPKTKQKKQKTQNPHKSSLGNLAKPTKTNATNPNNKTPSPSCAPYTPKSRRASKKKTCKTYYQRPFDPIKIPIRANIRRSLRIAVRTMRFNSLFTIFSCLTFLIFSCLSSPSLASSIVMTEAEALVERGHISVTVATRIYPWQDIESTKIRVSAYEQACSRIAGERLEFKVCRRNVKQLQEELRELEEMCQSIYTNDEPLKTKRSKRSTREGALISSEPTDHPVALKHIIESQDVLKLYQKNTETDIDQQITVLYEQIDSQVSMFVHDLNNIRMFITFLHVYTSIHQHIRQTQRELNANSISDDELYRIITAVHKKTSLKLPTISIPELRQMMDTTLFIQEGELHHNITLPLILNVYFELVKVIPLPVNQTHIPDFKATTVLISPHFYTTQFEVTRRLTKGRVFTKVDILEKVADNVECAIALATGRLTNKCTVRQLPRIYDEWMALPAPNTYAFYSNTHRELQCPNSRTSIENVTGILVIPLDCYVDTPLLRIYAIAENSDKQEAFYQVPLEAVAPIELPETTTRELEWRLTTSKQNFDDFEIEIEKHVDEALDNLDDDESSRETIFTLSNTLIVWAGLWVVFIVVYIVVQRKRRQTRNTTPRSPLAIPNENEVIYNAPSIIMLNTLNTDESPIRSSSSLFVTSHATPQLISDSSSGFNTVWTTPQAGERKLFNSFSNN